MRKNPTDPNKTVTNFVFPKKDETDLSRLEEAIFPEKTENDKDEKIGPIWEFKKPESKRPSLVALPPLIQKSDQLPLKPKIIDPVKQPYPSSGLKTEIK